MRQYCTVNLVGPHPDASQALLPLQDRFFTLVFVERVGTKHRVTTLS